MKKLFILVLGCLALLNGTFIVSSNGGIPLEVQHMHVKRFIRSLKNKLEPLQKERDLLENDSDLTNYIAQLAENEKSLRDKQEAFDRIKDQPSSRAQTVALQDVEFAKGLLIDFKRSKSELEEKYQTLQGLNGAIDSLNKDIASEKARLKPPAPEKEKREWTRSA